MITTGMKDIGEGMQKINEAKQSIKEPEVSYHKYQCPNCNHEGITIQPLGFLCDNCNSHLHIQNIGS